MGRVRVNISGDGLVATAVAPAGPSSAQSDVEAALRDAGVVHGIDAGAVPAFAGRLADTTFAGSMVVARGTAPVAGSDGHVDDLDPVSRIAGQQRKDGSVDFRERHMLRAIPVDTAVARNVPPTSGTPGRDVRDRALAPKAGKAHRVRMGPGVRVDGDLVVATRGGCLLHDDRVIDVVSLYTHGGDVDYASGNLHTDGSLIVRGDVHEGFTATATGDVNVTGAVFGAEVQAGSIARIDQGVLGKDARVRAGGDVLCRHATSALLQAGGGVVIGDQAAHCRIRGATLTARSGRGAIVGGEARIASCIKIKVAGTPNGAATHLAVADPEADVPDAEPRPVGGSARATGAAVAVDRTEVLRRRERMRELMKTAVIEVSDTLWAGVRITIGDVTMVVDQARQNVRLRYAEATNSIAEEPLA